MTISSVRVETSGWVLAVTGDWGATAGAFDYSGADRTEGAYRAGGVDQFPLDPNGAPKVLVQVERQGFARAGDRSVSASSGDVQTLIATKVVRKPYPNQDEIDETDNGDGTRTVRLALSEFVYAGDVIKGVSFASGWKAGEAGGAVSQANCSNDSAAPKPVAISRCVQPEFELLKGTTLKTFEYLIASHHPRHSGIELHQAVAGAFVTVTDGTHTVGPFSGQVGTSDRGDGLRCWRFACDLDGLDAGPVSVHLTTYPWVGQMRSTGSGQSTDATAGMPVGWANPHMLCYDPDGTLYPYAHVFVDAATGTSTAGSVTVAGDLATAKAGTPAADVMTAIAALYSKSYSLPARNGWAASPSGKRSLDWCTVTLGAGVQAFGTGSSNVGNLYGLKRLWFEHMAIEMGESRWTSTGAGFVHAEDCELRGKAGFETSTAAPPLFYGNQITGYAGFSMSRCRYWKFGALLNASGTTRRFSLMRSVECSVSTAAIVQVNCTKPEDGYSNRQGVAFGGWRNAPVTDQIIWGCTAYNWHDYGFDSVGARESGAGTLADPYVETRFAAINVLVESVDPMKSGSRLYEVGGSPRMLQQSIFEGISSPGKGMNGFYDGGTTVPAGPANTHVRLDHVQNRFANNYILRMAIKGDQFMQDGALTGYFPHLYGVGYKANAHGNGTPTEASNFQYAFYGIGSLTNTDYATSYAANWAGFVDVQAESFGTGDGWGDYHPGEGSLLLGRGAVANIDADVEGVSRGRIFSTGAVVSEFDGVAASSELGATNARHGVTSTAPALHVVNGVAPAPDWLEVRDESSAVHGGEIGIGVAPQGGRIAVRSTSVAAAMALARDSGLRGRIVGVNRNDRVLRAGPD